MGFIKNIVKVDRDNVYVIMRIDLSEFHKFRETPVRAFTTIEKARDYLKKIKSDFANLLVDEDVYGGVFEDEYGIETWAYRICYLELDTEYGEETFIGNTPAFPKDE